LTIVIHTENHKRSRLSLPFFGGKMKYPTERGLFMIENFLISEEQYDKEREAVIERFIESLKEDGKIWYEGNPGQAIHFEWLQHKNPKKTVMVSHGFVENAQKFHEVAYYFYMAGCNVCLIDQIGHGESYRLVDDNSIVYVKHFSDYVKVLHQLIEEVVKPKANGTPIVLYGHSMGGCITAFEMLKHSKDYEHVILTSPMIRPLTMGFPMWMAKMMAITGKVFGKSKKGVLGKKGYDPEEAFADSPDTSEARFNYNREIRRNNPNSQNSHPTYGWAHESFYVDKYLLNKERCEKVACPVTMFIAENDTFVSIEAEQAFAALLPNCEAVFMPGTKHEIYMSDNATLVDYWNRIYTVLGLND